ncbi:UbiA family prenyltransferase [Microbacterium schleiferi]|uniref:UbiA family prenyltransferase n=1 Tax=Microbacterium schleiferi TaxID=69362 RepID=A0ABU7V9N9_9MICO
MASRQTSPVTTGFGGRVLALLACSHPGPTVVVTTLAGLLAVGAGIGVERIALTVAAVLFGQLSVGWSNDAIDAPRDIAVGRRDKPIAAGVISRRAVAAAAGVALVLALGVSGVIGWQFCLAHGIALASAWAYNAWLKFTWASVIPFAVSFGILPSLATLAAALPAVAPWWQGAAGALLGVAVHLTNVVPDLADDEATGVRGLGHRIGATPSAIAAFAAVIAGTVVVLVGSFGEAPPAVALAASASVVACAVAGLLRALRKPDRLVFRLVMASGLILAAQLVLTAFAA